jgi:hypothetical protein
MKRCLSSGNVHTLSSDSDDSPMKSTTQKSRKNRKKRISTSQPSQPTASQREINIDNIINSVAHTSGAVQSPNQHLEKQVTDLKQIITRQNAVINNVVSRLNFLLSMFNIDEVPLTTEFLSDSVIGVDSGLPDNQRSVLSTHDPAGLTNLNHGVEQNGTTSTASTSTSTAVEHTVPPVEVYTSTSVKQSYSSVVKQNNNPTKQTQQQLFKFRQSLVAAVYIDQREKNRRASSFIISGLPTSTVHSDKAIANDMCLHEFNVQIEVVSTKRLGKPDTSLLSATKIQPLLVTVKDADQAKLIISSARQLRQSEVAHVRANVFINPNLTKAEASAAYELRCRHREAASRRSATEPLVRVLDPDLPPFVPLSLTVPDA